MKFTCVCDRIILLIKCSVILLRVLKCLRTPVISCYFEVQGMAVESILWHIFCFTNHVLAIFIVSCSWNSNLIIKMFIVLVYLPSEEINIVLLRYPRILSMAPAVLCSSRKCPMMPLKRHGHLIMCNHLTISWVDLSLVYYRGSLLTRNLADLVKKEHFILDSEYLTTLLVIVPKWASVEYYLSYSKESS